MLLDTNIIIELFKGDVKLSDYLDKQSVVYIPSIVLGELYLGAYRSANTAKNIKKIRSLMERCTILAVDEETADHFGAIKAELLKKGKPIPENDIWIAAIAKQYDLQTLTNDKHFKNVPGIKVKYLGQY